MKRAVLAALVLIALAWWLLSREPAPPVQGEPVESPAATRGLRQAHPERISLPVPSAPLREALPALERAAAAGRADAACRVAIERLACQITHLASFRAESLEAMERRIRSYPISEASRRAQLEEARRAHAGRLAAQAHCDGVATDTAATLRHLAIAGRAGHGPSQAYYFVPDLLTSGALMGDPTLLADFRATAPRFFRARLEAGDPVAIEVWELALGSQGPSPLAEVLPADWRARPGIAVALRELHEDHVKPAVMIPRARLAEPTAADRTEAQRLYERFFRNAAPREPSLDAAIVRYDIGASAHEVCADLAPR